MVVGTCCYDETSSRDGILYTSFIHMLQRREGGRGREREGEGGGGREREGEGEKDQISATLMMHLSAHTHILQLTLITCLTRMV